MFDVFCPTCEARVLLTPRRIEQLRNTAEGIVVAWRCWCGTRGELHTGRSTGTAPEPEHRQAAPDVVPA